MVRPPQLAAPSSSSSLSQARPPLTLSAQSLPQLSPINVQDNVDTDEARKCIHSDADVEVWKASQAHKHIVLFLGRLCEASVGKATRVRQKVDLTNTTGSSIDRVWLLLDELQQWSVDIEPLKTPQRFGNLAFRNWGDRIEKLCQSLHKQLLPENLRDYITELSSYLLGSFGSWIRLDYGSGHELSFIAWLCFLARLQMFADIADFEECLALEIIPKYLEVVWSLQDRYGLEPAGSHGVWGLDDYQFVPYAIGAAQLRAQIAYAPSAVSSPIHKPDPSPMSPHQLLQFIPRSTAMHGTPASQLPGGSSTAVPPFANLYTASIARIHSLKRGPFHEHSPILHDVASTVPSWIKVHAGMMKMWQAECLGKRPVVQHFPFGQTCFVWPTEEQASTEQQHQQQHRSSEVSIRSSMAPPVTAPTAMAPTAAPWANVTPSLQRPDVAGITRAPRFTPTAMPSGRSIASPTVRASDQRSNGAPPQK